MHGVRVARNIIVHSLCASVVRCSSNWVTLGKLPKDLND